MPLLVNSIKSEIILIQHKLSENKGEKTTKPISYGASITQIPNPGQDITQKLQTNIPDGYRHKNRSKPNPAATKRSIQHD